MRVPKISLDVDGTIANFEKSYNEYFNTDISKENSYLITKRVHKIRYCKDFWTSLPVLERINFEPHIYATKRTNPKSYTRFWLEYNGFPVKPIYQTVYQKGNKADIIKGRCDVLIDDSPDNVLDCLKADLPALLIDRPYNQDFGPFCRIYHLDIDEITECYNLLCDTMFNDYPFTRHIRTAKDSR